VRFLAVRLLVVVNQVALQAGIGFGLRFRCVEVVQGLVDFFDRPERTLYLPLERAVVRRPSLPAGMWVRTSMPRYPITF